MTAYQSHARQPFSAERFREPPSDCRGAPFWSWNGMLDRDRLLRQLGWLKEMGMGGAHIHPRTGLASPAYLSEAFLALVRDCADACERMGMRIWLYDEDRWPSGFAGGLVTVDPAWRCRHLRLTLRPCAAGETRTAPVHHDVPHPVAERTLFAAWALRRDAEGRLLAVRRLAADAVPDVGETGLWAYAEVSPTSAWFNHQAYTDLLNPDAVSRFIEVTHERYAAALGDRLGRSVPAIFTDEPLLRNSRPVLLSADADAFLPWTDDLPETYLAATGAALADAVPGLVCERADGGSALDRWRFHDHLAERMVAAFSDQVGAWCQRHGILSTGHLMNEETLSGQTASMMDAMRHYRGFQLPGIDLLCDNLEFTTAKQAQSAARQYGRIGLMSELYGVTNWDFDFQGHKRQGDWQAALGIVLRVHHLAWYTMAGEAKRDYPAAIGWQSPWWRAYPVVEDHFARLNTVLTRGQPHCRVAVVHPVESFWLVRHPAGWHADECAAQESAFQEVARWLIHGLIDFDYLAESLLPAQCALGGAPLRVGAMAYDVVVVPRLRTIRSSTLDRLEAFAAAGGSVIFAGGVPALVDAVPSDRAERLAGRGLRIGLDQAELLAALAPWRELDCRDSEGGRGKLVHQMRIEDDGRWLFVCNAERDRTHAGELRLRGCWRVETLDTATGAIAVADAARIDGGWTVLPVELAGAGHILLRLRLGTPVPAAPIARQPWIEAFRVADPVDIALDEPNALLLDHGAWRLDGGAWQSATEVLRADNLARRAAGLPARHGNIAQPWSTPPRPACHRVGIAFTVCCDAPVRAPRLALERSQAAAIVLDGAVIPARADGHYIDEDIHTVPLPEMAVGEHRIEIDLPLEDAFGLESCWLLGDFGVQVSGRHARIGLPVRTLTWGDWTQQGLAFYGGNVTYRCRLHVDGIGPRRLAIPRFRSPAVRVDLAGRSGHIAFAPYRMVLPELPAGDHDLILTAYGNRMNTCGQVHNANPNYRWWGPSSFRTTGDLWSDEYVLRPQGILGAPVVETPAG